MKESKMGSLIAVLRKEKGMTQKMVAEQIGVLPKTVSKWETGAGCPDISLLPKLAEVLDVSAEQLLDGRLPCSPWDGGNMKRIQFYYCKECGNVLMSTGASEVICCGRKLTALPEQKADAAHRAETELQDGEWYVTVPHVMTKEHFLVFAVWVSYDRTLLIRLYPEQNAEFRMPMLRKGTLYLCCSEHGLFRQTIKDSIN